MRLNESDLQRAVSGGIIGREQADAILRLAAERHETSPSLSVQHLAYYLGGLIVIGAMGWYVTNAWVRMSPWGFITTAVVYAAAFLATGAWLWRVPGGRIPGGMLVTLAVCMTPMAVYGVELLLDLWPQGPPNLYTDFFRRARACWLAMEAATILAGLLALRRWRFPFLTAPISVALWFMSMDLTPLLFGQASFTWAERRWVSVCFGFAMLVVAAVIDRRAREDYAFWGYLFGLLAFWGGLTGMDSNSELDKFVYCMVNVVLLLAGVLLERRAFPVFGGLGVLIYQGHLARKVFRDSMAFPFVVSAAGLAIIWLGWIWQKRAAEIDAFVLARTPGWLRRSLPRYRT
jgi:hypothetical protein